MALSTLSKEQAIERAKSALHVFWETAHSEFPENMPASFAEFYAYMQQRSVDFFVDFGRSCDDLEHNWGHNAQDVDDAMQELARKNQGQVSQYDDGFPKGSDFFDALLGKFNNWDAKRIAFATADVAKTTAQKAVQVAEIGLTGYLGFAAIASIVGIFVVITSFRKR